MEIETVGLVVSLVVITSGIALMWDARRQHAEVLGMLAHLIEDKRLSVVLNFSPSSVAIDPARFEVNKPELTRRLLTALEQRWEKKDTMVGTDGVANLVTDQSGIKRFVTDETKTNVRRALTRLIINNDKEGARRFLEVVVNQL